MRSAWLWFVLLVMFALGCEAIAKFDRDKIGQPTAPPPTLPPRDSGVTRADAATREDAGEEEEDAGEDELDAGEEELDAGEEELDAGEGDVDAGEGGLDAGDDAQVGDAAEPMAADAAADGALDDTDAGADAALEDAGVDG